MITHPGNFRIFLAAEPVDFRKGMDGLAAIIANNFELDPFCGAIYVFRSRRADRLKLIVWDGTGLVLIMKRLERKRFVNTISGVSEEAGSAISARVGDILKVHSESSKRVTESKLTISTLKGDLRRVKEQLSVLRQEHFGKSSEKSVETTTDLDIDFGLDDLDHEPVEKLRGKQKRKFPADMPIQVNDIFPDSRDCDTCGCEMPSIGRWTSKLYQIVPEHIICVENRHHKCACNREICKDNKPKAAKAKRFIMKGHSYELELMVEAAVQKFAEHIPPFRIERRSRNGNTNVTRQAIGNGIAWVGEHLVPIQNAILAHVTDGHAAHMDETPMKVQAPGAGKCDTGYLWAICRDERRWNPEAQPAAYFKYANTRSGSVASELLAGTAISVLQVDGYAGYNSLTKADRVGGPIYRIMCWAHARRKFVEAFTATNSKLADRIVKLIGKMYLVEEAASGLSADSRLILRREKTRPILQAIWDELIKHEPSAQGLLRSAINYVLKARDALTYFVEDGRLEIDNNPVERCIRGIAITKKNSLFAGTHKMAEVWATYFTLIETCKLNRIDPRRYLLWATGEIERTRGDIDYALLTPWLCPVGKIEA